MPNTELDFVPENLHCIACEKVTLHSAIYSVMKDASNREVARVLQSKTCKTCGKKS